MNVPVPALKLNIRVPVGEMALNPVKRGDFPEGIGWSKRDLTTSLAMGGWLGAVVGWNDSHDKGDVYKGESAMADLVEKLDAASDAVDKAYERFDEKRMKFRGQMGNEVASIGASANKIVAEFTKLITTINNVQTLLTSTEMMNAIANAERLATAFQAINAMSAHKITFAVIDNKGVQDGEAT